MFIYRFLARKNGYKVDSSQELVALGKFSACLFNDSYRVVVCVHSFFQLLTMTIFTHSGLSNLASSFVGSYPVTGSFSR